MELKKEKTVNSLRVIRRYLSGAKWKILCSTILVLFILFVGCIFGLFLAGALNISPQEIRNKMYDLRISDEASLLEEIAKGIVHENIRIPYDYFLNQFVTTDKMYIDIKFEDYQKIVYKRQQALIAGALFTSSEDYVSAKISYDGKKHNADIRLKGDWGDHWNRDKWSFRIKVKGNEKILGMERFSIQSPKTRLGVNEYIYMMFLKSRGLIGLRYKFIEVTINGENKGIYALEEHFSKELIESNKFREGPIFKFNEDALFLDSVLRKKNGINDSYLFSKSAVESFDNYEDIMESEVLTEQFIEGMGLLSSLNRGLLSPHQVFDSDQFAKYYAISTLLNCPHSDRWHNMRFYYNPITSLLEPIGFDGECSISPGDVLINYLPDEIVFPSDPNSKYSSLSVDLPKVILSDKVMFEKYIRELEKLLEEETLNPIMDNMESELNVNIKTIKKDNPFYFFEEDGLENSRIELLKELEQPMAINAYLENIFNGIKLKIESTSKFPIEIMGVECLDEVMSPNEFTLLQPEKTILPPLRYEVTFMLPKDYLAKDLDVSNLNVIYRILGSSKIFKREVYPWKLPLDEFANQSFIRKKYNLSELDSAIIDEGAMTITFLEGNLSIRQNVIIPEGFDVIMKSGTNLDILNSSTIISYSNIAFIGNTQEPIWITSSDGTGQGINIIGPLNKSVISYVIFDGLSNPHKNNWQLSGAINFYDTEVYFQDVILSNMNAEDTLNLVKTKFNIQDTTFLNCSSDCFDNDFGTGVLNYSIFTNCGNDCLDFSGSNIIVENTRILNAGDKGISAGEVTNITAKNLTIIGDSTHIAIASKDSSFINLTGAIINGPKYGFAVYQKKAEYGPSSIWAVGINISSVKNPYILEKGSSLTLNDIMILNSEKKVVDSLYEA